MEAPEPLSAEFFCASCRTAFQNPFPLDAEGRCALCRSGLRGFDAAYSFGAYEGVLRELIHLYKYGKIKTLARPLSSLLTQALPRDEAFDAVVPVPFTGAAGCREVSISRTCWPEAWRAAPAFRW